MMERGFGCCNGSAISRCLGSGSNVLQYMEEKRGLFGGSHYTLLNQQIRHTMLLHSNKLK